MYVCQMRRARNYCQTTAMFIHYLVVFTIVSCSYANEVNEIKPAFPFNVTISADCKCPMIVDPVCGRIGPMQYTYVNECILNCSKQKSKDLSLLYHGACCRQQRCSLFDAPVCDHNGKMYENSCSFEAAQCIDLRQHGRHLSMDSTAPACSCLSTCQEEWDPVCDSNGKTHANPCTFHNHKCLQQQFKSTVTIDYKGTCCDDMCTTGHSTTALCDSEGETHLDLCSFYKSQCQRIRRNPKASKLRVMSLGVCKKKNQQINSAFYYFTHRFPAFH